MSSPAPSFKIFLLFLFIAAFVLVAAHQNRHDYFRMGRPGLAAGNGTIKEFYVDDVSDKQEKQLKKSQPTSLLGSTSETKEGESTIADIFAPSQAPDSSGDSADKTKPNTLLEQIMP